MEYLDIRGAVKLKADADESILKYILQQLLKTEFSDSGYISIHLENHILSISAEGTISDRYGILALFDELQGQLIGTSKISVRSVRWELFVLLKLREPFPAKRREVQLAIAQ